MVVYTSRSSTSEAETGKLWVHGLPEIQKETLSLKQSQARILWQDPHKTRIPQPYVHCLSLGVSDHASVPSASWQRIVPWVLPLLPRLGVSSRWDTALPEANKSSGSHWGGAVHTERESNPTQGAQTCWCLLSMDCSSVRDEKGLFKAEPQIAKKSEAHSLLTMLMAKDATPKRFASFQVGTQRALFWKVHL